MILPYCWGMGGTKVIYAFDKDHRNRSRYL